jgi:hypothetical protein
MGIPDRRRREIRERQRERDDRYGDHVNTLTGLEGQDPTEVYDEARGWIWCCYAGEGKFFAHACCPGGVTGFMRVQMAPSTICAGCNRPLSDHATGAGTPRR